MADKYVMNNKKTDHSSAFGLNPEEFDAKIVENERKRKLFKQRLRELLLESPSDLEIRFRDAINELKDMKEEFGIK